MKRSQFGKEEEGCGYGVFAAPAEAEWSWLLLTRWRHGLHFRFRGSLSFLHRARRFFSFSKRERKEWGRKICLLLSFRERKERDFTASLSFSYRANLLSFNRNDFTAIVVAASLAGSVRQAGLAALRASYDAGDRQFPVGAASLISSRAGYFSLGYCHLVHLLG